MSRPSTEELITQVLELTPRHKLLPLCRRLGLDTAGTDRDLAGRLVAAYIRTQSLPLPGEPVMPE